MIGLKPEMRARIIAGILQHIAEAPTPVRYSDLFRRALAATGLPEEEVGEDIRDATSCLIFAGTILCSGFDRERAAVTYAADTEMVLCPWLVRFVWSERLAGGTGRGGMSASLIIVAEWPKNDRENVRVALDEFNGHPVVSARLWFKGEDGNMRPGKTRLAIGVRHLPALAKVLNQALAIATEQGLIREAPHER